MVECNVAIVATGVRFPDDALFDQSCIEEYLFRKLAAATSDLGDLVSLYYDLLILIYTKENELMVSIHI